MSDVEVLEIPISHAIAKVNGEPISSLPTDLYIPPEALEVFLESFEGPLDLLLYLIRKNSLDILDIPMAELTRQYMSYVEAMRQGRLELAAEYLVMAAVLIEIKSRMLLPVPPASTEEEEIDPRAVLMRRLLEYERIKMAAHELEEMPREGREFKHARAWVDDVLLERLPEVSLRDLQDAWVLVLSRIKINKHHRISREQLSVREYMTKILKRLNEHQFVAFMDLFDEGMSVPLAVVNFIAILELVKERMVNVSQTEAYAPLYVSLGGESVE
ncbi:MAG: segregation/condensation protein A [Ferrovum sp. 37-45-19]|uniref:segregation and condensation protein A n=1 Tax=Ferrovum sp. JA12 TaxID=1356299 RepID=UPI0007028F0E|nr:ScpA family protein [Ferrovum sp. JA12]OYV80667.1 MAG: segregation/condensation protein A [Ferrovum sp. 21-44-67]OYV95218.1 MAG: segregation/condensation protein A [Ferrovum sp. 37-45-19]OZB33763.1 MAG: segregation/condensation protein A [Ferrovum sp. 34-44-207]HQT80721.1 ScpA family protein [Ferrovaceae bacterium]KRH79814.1 segregation and condensation protein A [Ferrovum sp. JA12]